MVRLDAPVIRSTVSLWSMFHPTALVRFCCKVSGRGRRQIKSCPHDPFLSIRFLLVPKNRSCEHIKNDHLSNGSLILKKLMEIKHALLLSDTLLER